MIVQMKRVTILGLKSHADEIVGQLRDTGVVHVTHINPPESPGLEQVADKIFLSRMALEKLSFTGENQIEHGNVMDVVSRVVEISERLDKCEDDLGNLEQEEKRIAFLGDFNPEDIAELQKREIFISLYEFSRKDKFKNTLLQNLPFISIDGSESKKRTVAVVSYKKQIELEYGRISVPCDITSSGPGGD